MGMPLNYLPGTSLAYIPTGHLCSFSITYVRRNVLSPEYFKSTLAPSGHKRDSLILLMVSPSSLTPGLELSNCFFFFFLLELSYSQLMLRELVEILFQSVSCISF